MQGKCKELTLYFLAFPLANRDFSMGYERELARVPSRPKFFLLPFIHALELCNIPPGPTFLRLDHVEYISIRRKHPSTDSAFQKQFVVEEAACQRISRRHNRQAGDDNADDAGHRLRRNW